MRRWWKACWIVLGLALGPGLGAQAQDGRILRLVVPYPSGGILDAQARLVVPALRHHLQRELVVDNIAGAAGAIGLQHALAAADGTALVAGTDSDVVLAPLFNPELKYRPEQFRLLAVLGSAPMALLARPGLDLAVWTSLAAGAVRGDAELRLASYGVGSNAHLVADDYARRARARWLHVPYRGAGPLLQDLMGGVVDAAFLPLAAGVPDLVRAGRLQLLAVAATERVPGFAQVPTWEELGLDGFVHRSWSALLVPATVPAPALERLRAAAVATVQDGAVHQQLAAMGLAPVPLATDAEAQSFLAAEVRRYRGLAAAAARAVP